MKKFLGIGFLFSLILFHSSPSHALLYQNIIIPFDVAKNVNFNQSANLDTEKINLKKGTSSRTNVLGLVECGDAGILKAAKDGKITKIHYVEVNKEKLFIPLGFIPIYFDRYITNVYGE